MRTAPEALPEDAAPEGRPGQVRALLTLGWQACTALQRDEQGLGAGTWTPTERP